MSGKDVFHPEAVHNAAEFWSYVQVAGPDECWLWLRGFDAYGYGQLKYEGRTTKAHRLAYQFHHGVVLRPSQHVCHSCDKFHYVIAAQYGVSKSTIHAISRGQNWKRS